METAVDGGTATTLRRLRRAMKLADLAPGATVRGLAGGGAATVVSVERHGPDAATVVFRDREGAVRERLLFREDEERLEAAEAERPWTFDGDGDLFQLAAEAQRISLAHLFDPLLAVQTSQVDPLPHQITAVYEAMLPRQPLRFLLADDPGAGKTIMAGLLIKELLARGDAGRCLIVCPGSLVEQWQQELSERFGLDFAVLTRDQWNAATSGNWFLETAHGIARLDMLSRNEEMQARLRAPDCVYDLVVCDEAHKMSARYFGGEVKYTARYRLGRLLSERTRHLLLMTATPHRGIEADYQLFLALLDRDAFEGKYRKDAPAADTSYLMRRVVKENLLRFDGRPLFPERMAYTVQYRLSEAERHLYDAVTDYVREEFNRADAVGGEKRRTVGFALTVLQRRLASSPEAIHRSLQRRRERLERRREEMRTGAKAAAEPGRRRFRFPAADDWEEYEDEYDDLPDDEREEAESEVMDQATAARTISELDAEIGTLRRLERLSAEVRRSGEDAKWVGLRGVFEEKVFAGVPGAGVAEPRAPYGSGAIPPPRPSPSQKLVLFTEHRATLEYLEERIGAWIGRPEALAVIHGGLAREVRREAQERFVQDPEVRILLATDAAGEGINLQRAHLMVNYDLPWNPNRLEQRFGRIHRIGQTEVCHLWNLVADDTREGQVYERLLDKLETARQALGGQVFDVLGRLEFDGKPLRDLLLEAVRYGNQPEVRARLDRVVEGAVDARHLRNLIESQALAAETMDTRRVAKVRADLERAEARRLQPHFIGRFFRLAFARLGGTVRRREPGRYELTQVSARIRDEARRRFGTSRKPVVRRYERITFEKERVRVAGKSAVAEFLAPGHPLLDAVTGMTLDRHGDLLRRGAVLVDDRDPGTTPRVVVVLDHAVEDGGPALSGKRRAISRKMVAVELTEDGGVREAAAAPWLDCRPLAAEDPPAAEVLARPECAGIGPDLEKRARSHAIARVAPEHLAEARGRKQEMVEKTRRAVRQRLALEIAHWDRRAQELQADERAGKPAARMNSGEAQRRADDLRVRLDRRLRELEAEADIAAAPPVVRGALLIVPKGLLALMTGRGAEAAAEAVDTGPIAARARAIVMAKERELGFEPTDREFEKVGYDIESRRPDGGLRFLEVKGRSAAARTITVTRNEILTALNKPDDYLLALVRFGDDDSHELTYLRRPFGAHPDDAAASVDYAISRLLERAEPPS